MSRKELVMVFVISISARLLPDRGIENPFPKDLRESALSIIKRSPLYKVPTKGEIAECLAYIKSQPARM